MASEPIVYQVPFHHLVGESAREFQDCLGAFAARNPRALVIDMSAVQYVDSNGIGALLNLARLGRQQLPVILTNVRPPIRTLFRVARLDQVLQLAETVEDALHQLE